MSTILLDSYTALRREISLIFASELKKSNLGYQQAVILYSLTNAPSSMSELSAYTQSDPAATTRTVASLEKAGYVTRASDPSDARKTIIKLTPAGAAHAKVAVVARDNIAKMLSATLNKSEKKVLTDLLIKVTDGLLAQRKK